MRFHFTLATALILAGPALASSIETVGVTTKAGSIVVKSCADCPAPEPVVHRDSYIVPALRTGTQTIELKDINGEKKVVRTEAWMGGSPVVYISNPPKQDETAQPATTAPATKPATAVPVADSMISTQTQAIEAAAIGTTAAPPRDGIDKSATTAALDTDPAAAAPVETATAVKPLDASKFELRLQP